MTAECPGSAELERDVKMVLELKDKVAPGPAAFLVEVIDRLDAALRACRKNLEMHREVSLILKRSLDDLVERALRQPPTGPHATQPQTTDKDALSLPTHGAGSPCLYRDQCRGLISALRTRGSR